MKNKIKNKLGFTLLELLVVVVIIGILAAIALPQYRKAVARAELTQIINSVKSITNSQERYYLIYGAYAANLQGLDIDISNQVMCDISHKNWVNCYNGHLRIAHYYADSSEKYWTECLARDKILASACEAFMNIKADIEESAIMCGKVGGAPCYVAAKRKVM